MKKILIVALCISVLLNMLFLFSIGVNDMQWKNDYNILLLESCEVGNAYVGTTNTLLVELQYYNEEYNNIELFKEVDCFGNTEEGRE